MMLENGSLLFVETQCIASLQKVLRLYKSTNFKNNEWRNFNWLLRFYKNEQ
jgi:hypothetical protein